jgi:hypothetical protein
VLSRLVVLIAVIVAPVGACHHDKDPPPMHPKPGDLPPLPPSSGTPVGYLLDAATDLKLRDDQLTKLKEIDSSLAAQQAEIDTQLRAIEKPDKDLEKQEQQEHVRHNNAPGQGLKTNADAGRLHDAHDRNDQDALGRAFALLTPDQQVTARKLLEDRGIRSPGSKVEKRSHEDDAGEPLPEP